MSWNSEVKMMPNGRDTIPPVVLGCPRLNFGSALELFVTRPESVRCYLRLSVAQATSLPRSIELGLTPVVRIVPYILARPPWGTPCPHHAPLRPVKDTGTHKPLHSSCKAKYDIECTNPPLTFLTFKRQLVAKW